MEFESLLLTLEVLLFDGLLVQGLSDSQSCPAGGEWCLLVFNRKGLAVPSLSGRQGYRAPGGEGGEPHSELAICGQGLGFAACTGTGLCF